MLFILTKVLALPAVISILVLLKPRLLLDYVGISERPCNILKEMGSSFSNASFIFLYNSLHCSARVQYLCFNKFLQCSGTCIVLKNLRF